MKAKTFEEKTESKLNKMSDPNVMKELWKVLNDKFDNQFHNKRGNGYFQNGFDPKGGCIEYQDTTCKTCPRQVISVWITPRSQRLEVKEYRFMTANCCIGNFSTNSLEELLDAIQKCVDNRDKRNYLPYSADLYK